MSPSEFDLRSALRDGDGNGNGTGAIIDVDRIVTGGEAKRARRRVQLLTAAVAVVLAGAGGITTAALVGGGHAVHRNLGVTNGGAAARPDSGARAEASSTAAAGGSPPSRIVPGVAIPTATGTTPGVACPTTFPRLLLPGGGGSGQFGATGPLFGAPVRSIVVCSFGSVLNTGAGARPGRAVLTGTAATLLRTSLESAPTHAEVLKCPDIERPNADRVFAFIGVDATGTAERPVTTTLGVCNVKVTNGTAQRFDWRPPTNLLDTLLAIDPGAASSPVPGPHPTSSGVNHGSPVR